MLINACNVLLLFHNAFDTFCTGIPNNVNNLPVGIICVWVAFYMKYQKCIVNLNHSVYLRHRDIAEISNLVGPEGPRAISFEHFITFVQCKF